MGAIGSSTIKQGNRNKSIDQLWGAGENLTENTLEEAKTLDLLKEIKSTDLNMFNERKETVGKEVKENYVVSMRMLVKREIIKRNQILEL